MKAQALELGGRRIGDGERVFVVAEAGVNHFGRIEQAVQMVRAAAAAGADAVKFQACRVERFLAPRNPDYEEYRRASLPPDGYQAVAREARRAGILWFATPLDEESADMLEALDVPAFKVASGDLTHRPLLEHLARKRRPIILSTGMARLGEVRRAVDLMRSLGTGEIALLHCVSRYPSEPHEANLRAMATLRSALRIPIGFSDHTLGVSVPLAAVALGAAIIEKHFTLDRTLPGDDHRFSVEPDELRALVEGVRSVEAALGSSEKIPTEWEASAKLRYRRIVVAWRDLAAGEMLARDAVRFLRPDLPQAPPGDALDPWEWARVEGKRLASPVQAGEVILRTHFTGG